MANKSRLNKRTKSSKKRSSTKRTKSIKKRSSTKKRYSNKMTKSSKKRYSAKRRSSLAPRQEVNTRRRYLSPKQGIFTKDYIGIGYPQKTQYNEVIFDEVRYPLLVFTDNKEEIWNNTDLDAFVMSFGKTIDTSFDKLITQF